MRRGKPKLGAMRDVKPGAKRTRSAKPAKSSAKTGMKHLRKFSEAIVIVGQPLN